MSYRLSIRKQALKELEEVPVKIRKSIAAAIDTLADNPRPSGCKKLKGETEYLWRIRIGDYRMIYHIDDKQEIVEIRKIGNRKNVYQ
jgi:mRNA interferase RelE/StbE